MDCDQSLESSSCLEGEVVINAEPHAHEPSQDYSSFFVAKKAVPKRKYQHRKKAQKPSPQPKKGFF